eukprot:m.190211 g.190211  ORF g.190211 m.190211 type:complete len:228 (+) comp39430_c0_seq61:2066-2749(+)
MKKCICEICTCGRHRCPHRPVAKIRKGSSACLLSEYKQTFTHFPAKPRESFKPAYKPIERSGTLETKTTHRNDYVPHPLQAKSTQPVVTYAQPEKPMETQTEYAREFPEKQPEVRSPKKVIYVSHPEAAPFDGTTTQRHDFKDWTGTGPSQRFKVSRIYTPPKDKFQAILTLILRSMVTLSRGSPYGRLKLLLSLMLRLMTRLQIALISSRFHLPLPRGIKRETSEE